MIKKSGFTLIEMMVVVLIIGLLASIVTISVNNARMRGRDARRQADVDTIRNAVELLLNQNNGTWPAGIVNLTTYTTSVGWGTFGTALTGAGVLSVMPTPPVATTSYRFRRNGNNYEVDAQMEVTGAGTPAATDGGDCATRVELGTNLTTLLGC